MTHSENALTVTQCRIHRTCRVGACPVLEVSVTYPCLCPAGTETEELAPAVVRFNEAYRVMAENLTEWAQGSLFEAATADFSAAGPGAAYRFDRRLVICDMIAALDSPEEGGDSELTVTRTLRLTSRRRAADERQLTATDRWRWPELTLCPPKRRRGRSVSI